jgi:DNA-directed RNA polymerase I subunit RPA43
MSQSLKRKRKQDSTVDASLSKKKSRKEGQFNGDKKKKDKGKVKAKSEEFTVISASLVVSIPPVFATNPRAGAEEMLDSMIMRCVSVNCDLNVCIHRISSDISLPSVVLSLHIQIYNF